MNHTHPKSTWLLFFLAAVVLIATTKRVSALNVDSLKTELSKAENDTNRVNILIAIYAQHGKTSVEERFKYISEALALSTKLDYVKGRAKALHMLGVYYNENSQYDKALEFLGNALKACPPVEKQLQSDIYNSIGGAYYYKSDYKRALDNYLKSLSLADTRDKAGAAGTEVNISMIYYQNQNFADAEKYLQRAMPIWKQLKDTVDLSNTLAQLGNVYYAQQLYTKALACYSQSLAMAAGFKDKSYLITSLLGTSNVYKDMGDYPKAIGYCKQALAIGEEVGDRQSMVATYQDLGVIYGTMKNYPPAIDAFKQGEKIAKEIGSKYEAKEIYYNLSEVYALQNNYKDALKYQQMYSDLNDTLFNETNSQQLNELSAKYESEKKEKEIAVLNLQLLTKQKDQEVLNATIQKRSSILLGTIIGAVLLILSIILLFNRRRLMQRNQHQQEITQQRENTTTAIVQAQENERTRIARDLHDSVGTYLSTLKLNLQLYEPVIPADKAIGYQGALHLIDKTAVELRNIMKNLSNETLQEQGLVSAFEELTSRVNALGATRFDFHSDGMHERPDSIVELSLYRIGQELLVNCVKYAKAGHATLQLIADELSVTLMLEDNGIGFDPEKPVVQNAGHGMGMKNIRDRVSFIKGLMRIESGPGGSVFVIEVPKNK